MLAKRKGKVYDKGRNSGFSKKEDKGRKKTAGILPSMNSVQITDLGLPACPVMVPDFVEHPFHSTNWTIHWKALFLVFSLTERVSNLLKTIHLIIEELCQ